MEPDEVADAIEVMAWVGEQQREMTVAMLPTWEQYNKAKDKAYWQGVADGKAAEQYRIKQRIFGGWEEEV